MLKSSLILAMSLFGILKSKKTDPAMIISTPASDNFVLHFHDYQNRGKVDFTYYT